MKRLCDAGLTCVEGCNQTVVYRGRRKVSVRSHRRETAEPIVRQIEKQTGVKLR